MNKNVIWPTEVEDYVDNIIEVIEDIVDPQETSLANLKNFLCELALQKFLNSDELVLTESEFEEVYSKAITQTSLDKLIVEGIITFVEDSDGEVLYLLTDKGKQIAQLLPELPVSIDIESQVESSFSNTFNLPFEQLN